MEVLITLTGAVHIWRRYSQKFIWWHIILTFIVVSIRLL